MEKSVLFVDEVEIIRKCIKYVIGPTKYTGVLNVELVGIAPG